MDCIHKDLNYTCNLIGYEEDGDEEFNPSYDEEFRVDSDSDGVCLCNCDSDYKNCPSFEIDK